MANQSGWTEDILSLVGSGMHREMRKAMKEAAAQGGWRGRRTSKGHIFLVHESGASTTIAGTPSDGRTIKNTLADLKRASRGALSGV